MSSDPRFSEQVGELARCAHCGEVIEPRNDLGAWWHVTEGGRRVDPYNYGAGGGRYGFHLAVPIGGSPSDG